MVLLEPLTIDCLRKDGYRAIKNLQMLFCLVMTLFILICVSAGIAVGASGS